MAYPNQQYSYYDLLGPQYQEPADVDLYQGIYCPEVSPVYAPDSISPPPPPEYAWSRGVLETAKPAPKKEKKTVIFEPTCTVRIPHCDECPTAEDKSRLYYSRHELKMMNLEANALCILSRSLPAIESSGTHLDRRDSVIMKSSSVAKDTPRGLELKMYPARQRAKFIANKSLLRYQRLLDTKPIIDSETRLMALAGASRKLTAWSSLVAAETARWDALRAYDTDGYTIPIDESEPVNIITTSPFSAIISTKRRRLRQEQEQHHASRRVTLEDEARATRRRKVDENVQIDI